MIQTNMKVEKTPNLAEATQTVMAPRSHAILADLAKMCASNDEPWYVYMYIYIYIYNR